MATTTFTTMIPTPSTKTTATKRPGPPVPPRPQQSSLLRTQRDAAAAGSGASAANLPQRSSSKVGLEQPQILKKPAPVAATMSGNAASGGRTVIYKSPSLNLQKRQEEREKRGGESQGGGSGGGGGGTPSTTTKANAVTQTTTTASSTTKLANGTHAPKPPLKLRKAPDVPTAKARTQTATSDATSPPPPTQQAAATTPAGKVVDENRDNNNIVIVQSSQGSVTLNRHHSMNTPSSHQKPPTNLKDSRLSLGRADFERVGNKISLSQLQPTTQPLPRPRKIVKIPVATIDMEDTNSINSSSTTTSSSSNSHGTSNLGVSLFKRSKTTLDNFTSRAHITTVSTGTAGGYLSGKTVEIKNNLKNAAERLFSEIMVNQQKHDSAVGLNSMMMITKHERAIQHQTVVETTGVTPTPAPLQNNVTVVNTANEEASAKISDNCTRINIITTTPTHTTNAGSQKQDQQHQQQQQQQQHIGVRQVVSAFNSPEKKSAAFHEMLISELAAMRTRSCSMENLQTKSHVHNEVQQQQQKQQLQLQFTAAAPAKAPEIKTNTKLQDEQSNPDDDIDADNVEDADGDAEDDDDGDDTENVLKKSLKVINGNAQNSPRKRTPSGCSSDSSPYGTERSSRIRTSDWIEVGDNGKQVTLTSCHISLEDSGLEDEERMDEMSSSGVGDSWDSVKEAEQYHHHQQQQLIQQEQQQQHQQQQQSKRSSRSVKRIMSINDLPPLPKSLSGINKMLASDSGLISDVDTEMARNAKNSESQKENNNNNSNNNNNNISIKDTGDKLNNSTLIMEATASTTTSPAAGSASANETTTTTTTPLKEINGNETISEIPPAIPGSKLDNQIATLRKEMFGLRQLDLTLLSQLWALNDSIQEFRTMIQENEQEDDETYSTHSRSPSPYDSVSSDGDDEISALKGKKLLDMQNANNNASVITTQPKLTPKSYGSENETTTKQLANNRQSTTSSIGSSVGGGVGSDMATFSDQRSHLMKPPLPKPLDVKPVPRMRSAPPPPPTHRKSQNAPPRPT